MRPFRLSRRTVLRGLGLAPISIALPTLDAMLDGRGRVHGPRGAIAAPPINLLTVFIPNGVYPDAFWPTDAGPDYTLSRCLMPLAPWKGDFNLLANLRKDEAFRGQDITTDAHARGHASFATGGSLVRGGVEFPSVEQVAAARLGNDTRFRSLPVALGGVRTVTNQQQYISWTPGGAVGGTALPPERNPVALFNKLFGMSPATGVQPVAAPARALVAYTKSILDYVRADVADLQPKLGASDRSRLDQHLTAVRDLEKQIVVPGGAVGPPSCTTASEAPPVSMNNEPPGIDDGRGGYSNDRTKALMRLQVMALGCGLTRFGSFQMAARTNKRQFGWLGATDGADGHHGISHDSSPAGYEKQAKIVTDEIEQFAFMLKLMKEMKRGDKDLLHDSIVFFASEHGHGEAHDFAKVPVIIAGQGGGGIRTGRYVVYKSGTRYANVFISILHLLGIPVTTFGATGNAPLAEVA